MNTRMSDTTRRIAKGFTFIELAITISIIMIITGIVLMNVSEARKKSADATIKGKLAIIQSRAEIYYGSHLNYSYETSACNWQLFGDPGNGTNDDVVRSARIAAENASGESASCAASDNTISSGEPAKTWAISVPLKSDPNKHWCVDSSGNSGERDDPVDANPGGTDITQLGDPLGIARCPNP